MGSALAALLPAAGLQLLTLSQVAVILAAGLFAAISLAGIHGVLRREGDPYSRSGWRIVIAICGVYLIGVLALIAAA